MSESGIYLGIVLVVNIIIIGIVLRAAWRYFVSYLFVKALDLIRFANSLRVIDNLAFKAFLEFEAASGRKDRERVRMLDRMRMLQRERILKNTWKERNSADRLKTLKEPENVSKQH